MPCNTFLGKKKNKKQKKKEEKQAKARESYEGLKYLTNYRSSSSLISAQLVLNTVRLGPQSWLTSLSPSQYLSHYQTLWKEWVMLTGQIP